MQWFIWWLAAAGKFFEGMVVFTTGVALPLMAKEFALGATEKGVVAAASLFGILIGAATLGGRLSSDRRLGGHGRRFRDPVREPQRRGVAVDVCQHPRACGAGHHRPFFYRPKPAVANVSRSR